MYLHAQCWLCNETLDAALKNAGTDQALLYIPIELMS